ncbi:hypothetical protein UCDDS831_g04070 [Diplodia seriata]|uniref:Uncharacterized protein n=1 Tax=Diplodia seriata TaxID=420778 RepID=A0A0G2GYW9_9PEZI|nr:hypothetical protein UCDDS831_g04070 [Diplodia seriata]
MASIQNIPPPSPRKQRLRKVKRAPKDAMDWTKKQYNQQYDRWVPWLEDQYLKYFTKDNKASYATKGLFPPTSIPSRSILPSQPPTHPALISDQLAKTKVTGDSRVDKLQDDVSGTAAGQIGQGGLAQPVGDLFSKEAVNRAERGGKDDQGGYVPADASTTTPAGDAPSQLNKTAESVTEGAKSATGSVTGSVGQAGESAKEGAGKAGGYFGGWLGGGKK